MAGKHFTGQSPFRDIRLTGLIRDKTGRKMSKSLGNGMDPLEIVEDFGADALKFSLAYATSGSQDIRLERNDFQLGSRFANKIWNAARYIIMNLPDSGLEEPHRVEHRPIDRWIRQRLNQTIATVDRAMQLYRFDDATHAVYEYFWSDFCDWYIEASKPALNSDDHSERTRVACLSAFDLLNRGLRLLHPFLPFITEELYQRLPRSTAAGLQPDIMSSSYPQIESLGEQQADPALANNFAALQELIPQSTHVSQRVFDCAQRTDRSFCAFRARLPGGHLHRRAAIVGRLLHCCWSGRYWPAHGRKRGGAMSKSAIKLVGAGYEIYMSAGAHIDVAKQLARMRTQLSELERMLNRAHRLLANQAFVSNADPAIVQREQEKAGQLEQQRSALEHYVAQLSGTDSHS